MLLSELGKDAGWEGITLCCRQFCFMSSFPCGVVEEVGVEKESCFCHI